MGKAGHGDSIWPGCDGDGSSVYNSSVGVLSGHGDE